MSTEAALMGAILAHPDEDTPRLAYADWLDEHADALAPRDPKEVRARAEFIRLQVACDGRDDDPEFDDARARAWSLQRRYFTAWQPPPLDRGPFWEKRQLSWEFRRGFAEHPYLDPVAFPDAAEKLFALAPMRKLAGLVTAEVAETLARCPHLRQIRTLALSPGARLTAAHVRLLFTSPYLAGLREVQLNWMSAFLEPAVEALATTDHFAGLEVLDFGQEQFPPAVAGAVARSKTLRPKRLTAWGSDCGDGGARLLAGSPVLERVEVLRLGGRFTGAGVKALAESPHLGPVWNLDLSGNPVGAAGGAALAGSPRLARLNVLDLGVTRLPLDGLAALARSEHLRELKGLNLRWNSLRAPAGEVLATGPAFANLRALNLNSNPVRDAGVEALARSPRLGELRRLDLTGCKLTAAGARALAAGPGLRALTHLTLGSNRLEDAGAAALAGGVGFPNLRVLALNNNLIGDAGAVALANSPQFATVEELNLGSNKITDVGAKALIESPHLSRVRSLRFKRNKVSRAVKAALAKRFDGTDEE